MCMECYLQPYPPDTVGTTGRGTNKGEKRKKNENYKVVSRDQEVVSLEMPDPSSSRADDSEATEIPIS
ncbi:hypothetical protein CEXT_79041 [Caerostris extrusa]|uniref:Uncharacterized protein n=1 Tax=Caerostris extrusa TaxID=172846 RepID=A0AAV4PQJ3_CAEEX|nr:hypothetical protein CEXT_79041 [Caerostris extrusa]